MLLGSNARIYGRFHPSFFILKTLSFPRMRVSKSQGIYFMIYIYSGKSSNFFLKTFQKTGISTPYHPKYIINTLQPQTVFRRYNVYIFLINSSINILSPFYNYTRYFIESFKKYSPHLVNI